MFHDLKLQLAAQACSSHQFLWPCVLFMEPDWNNSSAEIMQYKLILGEVHCWMCDGWTLTDVSRSRRLSAYASMTSCHSCSKSSARAGVINGRHSRMGAGKNQHVVHPSVSSRRSLWKQDRLKGRWALHQFFSFLASGLLKGTSVCSSKPPWDLSVISRKGEVVWCGENTCSDATASFPQRRESTN